ncbi:MAG: hypothetical protein IH840_15385 [Candidatus Heimdallarchaeota archaeon]|nr:hypothetical protein [Candidatus Heimdallarchaeota archaeon]
MEINLDEIAKNLEMVAKEDGKITKEEEEFLTNLQSNIKAFQISVNEVLADKIITDDEFDELVIMRDRILADAVSFDSDSEDISELIKQLYDQIDHFTIPGMLDDEIDEAE